MLFVLFFACTVFFVLFSVPNPSWFLSQFNLSKSVFEESLPLKQKKKKNQEKKKELFLYSGTISA